MTTKTKDKKEISPLRRRLQFRRLGTMVFVSIAAGFGLVIFFFTVGDKLSRSSTPSEVIGTLSGWAGVIVAFSVLLGSYSVMKHHVKRLLAEPKIGEKILSGLLVATFVFVVLGYLFDRLIGGNDFGSPSGVLNFLFHYVYEPLNATFLSLIAFLIVGAATRTLRVKNVEATILLIVALITLIGLSPLTAEVTGLQLIASLSDWLLKYPVVAGVRGILIGVALGTITTSLRVLIGVDRQYLA